MEQTQIAMELFGKAGVEALPAIRQGMSEIREEAQEARRGDERRRTSRRSMISINGCENTFKQMQIGATEIDGRSGDRDGSVQGRDVVAGGTRSAASIQVPDLPSSDSRSMRRIPGARTRATAELTEGY